MRARALFVLVRQHVIRFSTMYPVDLNPGVDELPTIFETLSAESPEDECTAAP